MKRLDGAFAKFARSQAGMATRWSLTFPQRNFTKDNIELANIVYSEKGLVKGTKWTPLSRKIRDKLSQIFTGANKTKGK